MSSSVSNSKRLHGPVADGVDSLSSLADPLLHLVMSFLPMPEVVRKCLLSPRWHDLWASMPFIHLDYKDFMDGDYDWEKRMADRNRLQKFGDQLLLLRDGTLPLDEARIFFRGGDFANKCDTWIRHIRHKARLLHVYCSSVITTIFDNRSMFHSQHLRRIKLQEVSSDDRFFRPLNFDFHVLEHIELEHCNVWDPQQMSSRFE
ncbi:putative F-box/LRR-repeat protein At5g38386 [Aegilops tauschii subsp. strangulata]|uniref:putative F-box/LRR-repeat protein At5g38386 n=1 Tax=Aegilops tauschii subsp. strangulata TaxID=200361 RepID=UPI00098B2159|nr:putative FBD-associated F-box protein At5g53635 [Aegilops tauschii subsp. strangulata]